MGMHDQLAAADWLPEVMQLSVATRGPCGSQPLPGRRGTAGTPPVSSTVPGQVKKKKKKATCTGVQNNMSGSLGNGLTPN